MFKLFGLLGFFYFSLDGGFHLPRLTHSDLDYVLMPLCGYLLIVLLPWIDHLFFAPLRARIQAASRSTPA